MASSDAGAAMRQPTLSTTLRIDPWLLPVTSATRQAGGSQKDAIAVETTISTEGVVIKRELECGLPITLSMPVEAFQGVAAHVTDHEDGTSTVVLQLKHRDPQLCVPLLETKDMDEAAADWQVWSRRLKLPMILVDNDGKGQLVGGAGGLTSRAPKARRRRVSAIRHRPSFLRRRHVGVVGPVVQIPVSELIARN